MTATVIIVTLNRPDCVRRCLDQLVAQEPSPDQIIVVDASPDTHTRAVVSEYPSVLYLRNENGHGRMTQSRNIGLRQTTGDIIAFLDDDAFAHRGWLANLLEPYSSDPVIGSVGGRALNDQPGEAVHGVDQIGKLLPNGVLTGNFAADPGRIIDADHVMGCNMSFRRSVLAELGGFREDYPGVSGVREDSDMCLRVRRAGYRLVFTPLACVDHIGAPQVKGRRFDLRYAYYAVRNHYVLLIRNFGPVSPIVLRYLLSSSVEAVGDFLKRLASACARFASFVVGGLAGIGAGLLLWARQGKSPIRRDKLGQQIRDSFASDSAKDTESQR